MLCAEDEDSVVFVVHRYPNRSYLCGRSFLAAQAVERLSSLEMTVKDVFLLPTTWPLERACHIYLPLNAETE